MSSSNTENPWAKPLGINSCLLLFPVNSIEKCLPKVGESFLKSTATSNTLPFITLVNFVQDNQSISQRGVIRGLHLQKGEFAQAKLTFKPIFSSNFF